MVCLVLVFVTLIPALAMMAVIDPYQVKGQVIFEDPALIAGWDEYILNAMGALSEGADPPDETGEPAEGPEPTTGPTQPPASPPAPAYEIQMEPPSGWYLNRAVMEITVMDTGGTGWASVRVIMERNGSAVTLIDGALPSGHVWIDLLDNCTVEAVVTDPNGGKQSKKVTVACFDKEKPNLTASVKGEYLHIVASDSGSGVAAVQVNGTTYTELNEGKLELWLKEYADAYEQLIIQAVDKVGNVSKAIAVATPFFRITGTPTPNPTATPKPTNTPKPTKEGGSGSRGNQATPTPTMEPTPSPTPEPVTEPQPTPAVTIETGFPFYQSGNAVTRDLLYDKYTNKQFIAIETRNGDVFYIIIDYDKPLDEKGERYETYFLNLVDSRDLVDLVGEFKVQEPEVIYVTPEPTVQPTPAPVLPEPAPEKKDSGGGMLGIIAILAAAGGGAFWYFKIRKPSGGGKSKPQFDDYDLDDDDDDDEELVNEDE